MRIRGVVKYKNVGRSRASGQVIIDTDGPLAKENAYHEILRHVKRHLMSDDVHLENGIVFAGFRPVGEFDETLLVVEED